MITGELRNKVDKLWEEFWTGGIANPLAGHRADYVFAFCPHARHDRNAKREAGGAHRQSLWRTRSSPRRPAVPLVEFQESCRTRNAAAGARSCVSRISACLGGQGSRFAEYMKDAQLMVQKPSLLVSAVNMIDALPLERTDIKGDLYEYLLSKLNQAGVNGQFRTPRHIIRFMVAMLDPKADEVIGDPACGTAGFLVGAAEYLLEKYTSAQGVIEEEGQKIYSGDLFS